MMDCFDSAFIDFLISGNSRCLFLFFALKIWNIAMCSSGFRRGEGGRRFISGIRPPADPKGPPLYCLRYPLLDDWLSNFSDGQYPKSAQKLLFWPVFWKNCHRRRNFGQYKVSRVIWESSENQFCRPKKIKRLRKFFWESAPHLSRNS